MDTADVSILRNLYHPSCCGGKSCFPPGPRLNVAILYLRGKKRAPCFRYTMKAQGTFHLWSENCCAATQVRGWCRNNGGNDREGETCWEDMLAQYEKIFWQLIKRQVGRKWDRRRSVFSLCALKPCFPLTKKNIPEPFSAVVDRKRDY